MGIFLKEEFWSNPSVVAFITGAFTLLVAILPPLAISNSKKKKKANCQRLIEHPFFNRSESIKHHIDMTFTLDNKGKELVFKEILINQITIYQKHLHDLCLQIEQEEIENSQILHEKCLKTIDEMTYAHYNFYKQSSNYSLEEIEVLNKVMKKYAIWNTSNITSLQGNISMICSSSYCTDVQTQAAVIMDLFVGILVSSLGDAMSSFNTINGDLRGCSFRGVTIQ